MERMLPLCEAKMLDSYDHRDADVYRSAISTVFRMGSETPCRSGGTIMDARTREDRPDLPGRHRFGRPFAIRGPG